MLPAAERAEMVAESDPVAATTNGCVQLIRTVAGGDHFSMHVHNDAYEGMWHEWEQRRYLPARPDKPVAALGASLAGERPGESAAALAVVAAEERTEGLSLARALVFYGEVPSASSPSPRSQAARSPCGSP